VTDLPQLPASVLALCPSVRFEAPVPPCNRRYVLFKQFCLRVWAYFCYYPFEFTIVVLFFSAPRLMISLVFSRVKAAGSQTAGELTGVAADTAHAAAEAVSAMAGTAESAVMSPGLTAQQPNVTAVMACAMTVLAYYMGSRR